MKTILGSSLQNTKYLVIFGVMALAIVIGLMLKDYNIKIIYWLSVSLFVITLINLNIAVSLFIRLKTDGGMRGVRGKRGDKGPKGFPGRCELNLDGQCGIDNCKSKIQNKLLENCDHYSEVLNKREYERTEEEIKILSLYEQWIDEINKLCSGDKLIGNEDEFFDDIFSNSKNYCKY